MDNLCPTSTRFLASSFLLIALIGCEKKAPSAKEQPQHKAVPTAAAQDAARVWVEKAAAEALQISDPGTRASLLAEIVVLETAIGMPDRARENKDRARESLKSAERAINDTDPQLAWTKPNAFESLAKVAIALKDQEDARRYVQLAKSSAFDQGAAQKDSEYGDIAVIQVESGDFSGAKQTLSEISTPEKREEAALFTAIAQARAGDLGGARDAAMKMNPEGRDAVLRHVAEGQARRGDVASVLKTMGMMSPKSSDDYAFTVCAAAAEAGKMAEAVSFASQQADPARRIPLFVHIVHISGESGDVATARSVMQRAADAFNETPVGETRDRLTPYMVSGWRRAGDLALAQAIFAKAIAANPPPTRLQLAYLKQAAGDYEGARETGKTDTLFEMVGLSHLAEAQAKAGDVDGAVRAIAQISNESSRNDASVRVGIVQASKGDLKGARRTAGPAFASSSSNDEVYKKLATAAAKTVAGDEIQAWAEARDTPRQRYLIYLGAASGLLNREFKP
jgi:hypothetical protein